MRKSKALELITELENEVNTTNVKQQFWNDKMWAYVNAIFGDRSYSVAADMFGTYYHPVGRNRAYAEWNEDESAERIRIIKDLLRTYRTMIESDVYFRSNRFSGYTDPEIKREIIGDLTNWIIGGISAIALVATIFYYQGLINGKLEGLPQNCSCTKVCK